MREPQGASQKAATTPSVISRIARAWHVEDFSADPSTRKPPCTRCSKRKEPLRETDSKELLCLDCIFDSPECFKCRGLVWKSAGKLGPDRERYCLSCYAGLRICIRCFRLAGENSPDSTCSDCVKRIPLEVCRWCGTIDPESVALWHCCHTCKESEVVEYQLASEIFDEVEQFCEETFGLLVSKPYQLLLADEAPEQYLMTDSSLPHIRGKTVGGLYAFHSSFMWIRSGLPIWLFASIAAHEHTHAWQWEHCPGQTLQLKEGLARWIQLKVLLDLGHKNRAHELIMDECPVYGEGLRLCIQLEKKVGLADMLTTVCSMQSFTPEL